MNKYIKIFTYLVSLTAALFVAGCNDDIDPEITTLEVNRLFSPVEMKAQVVNKVSVRLDWKAVRDADSYTVEFFNNGVLDFSGTPYKTISGLTSEVLPYMVSGFAGETAYSVRVKAVGEGIAESKWVGATFTTDAEQIFLAVNPNEITATGVTLRWPAGEFATAIVLTPGDIIHTVTAGEVTAGVAVITGLASETDYTAKLMNGTATRGTISFKTLLDLGGATAVYPEDDLKAILESAQAGDVYALMPGTYATQDISINTSIAIKGARPSDKPILTGTVFRIKDGSGLNLKDLVLDGTGSLDGNQAIVYETALPEGVYGALRIESCLIKNYTKGTLYVNVAALIESVTITGCVYSNIECSGGDFIDFRQGLTNTFEFTNNTAYNSALARDFFRMDAGGSTNFPGVTSYITINTNTFSNVATGSKRILYIRLAMHEITCNKNIFANTEGYYTNQAATTIVAMADNNYFNAPNFTGSTVSGAKNDAGTYSTYDPGFANPTSGDFTVSNEDLIINRIGDPRWLP